MTKPVQALADEEQESVKSQHMYRTKVVGYVASSSCRIGRMPFQIMGYIAPSCIDGA